VGVNAIPFNDNHQRYVDSVNHFIGEPSPGLKFSGYEYTPHATYSVLFNNNMEFWINEDNFLVERYSSYDELKDCNKILISEKEALNIAESFAKIHDIRYDSKCLMVNETGLINGGDIIQYNFLWREYINGIESPNFTYISINPSSGKIVNYIGINRPITINITSKLTENDVVNIAKHHFKDVEIDTIETKLKIGYTNNGAQKLLWECKVYGKPKDYTLTGGILLIDAETGEIIQIGSWL
jgi:hypothetical protein